MKIAVIFPSRGMAFSQTCEELLENLEGYTYDIFFSHGVDIPDCFNKPLERALKGSYTHFWFVEEDMILPKGVLKSLLDEKVPAICCDYPVTGPKVSYRGGGSPFGDRKKEHFTIPGKASVFQDPDGYVIYGGTGCLLVTRKFLEAYKKPVFRTDIAWDVNIGDRFEATPRIIKGDLYGLHDVTFGLQAYGRGTPIKLTKVQCGQRKLKALGKPGTNNGEHQIEVWTELTPEILEVPELTSKNVLLNDGTVALMDIKRAKKLEKQGLVTIPKLKYVELIENETLNSINNV